MDDKEFNRLADTTLAQIEAALEASDAVLDFELQHGGVLEIEFANGSKIIVNKHGVAKEIRRLPFPSRSRSLGRHP